MDQLEHVNCPCCSENRHSVWGEESGYQAVKCQNCGLIYVNPRPSLATITSANRIGEHKTVGGNVNVRAHRAAAAIPRYTEQLRTMFTDLRAPVDWLDVGAGYGEFMEAASAALPVGSHISGIEPMAVKTAAARARGLDVTETRLEDVTDTFDVVSLINVFSHIPDFSSFGGHLRRILRPGGVLVLETGNAADLPSRADYPNILYLPDHLVFAGETQMARILSDLGFTVESMSRQPLDTPLFVVKNFVKGVTKGRLALSIPYSSPFRSVMYKARLTRA